MTQQQRMIIVTDEDDHDGNSRQGKAYVERIRAQLDALESRRFAYLQCALSARHTRTNKPQLSNTDLRVLTQLVLYAGADLASAWPSVQTIGERMSWPPRRVSRTIAELKAKGWLRRVARRSPLGGLMTSLNQFFVPAGAIMPWADEWAGPLPRTPKSIEECDQ